MSPYRAELCGLTSILFLIQWVCVAEKIEEGKVIIYCDNETALNEVFKTPRPTSNPYKQLAADIDLITCVRDLLLQLPLSLEVKKEWVKGHYTGSDRKLKHDLNDMADELAGNFNSSTRAAGNKPPILYPLYEAELIHKNTIVTSRLQQLVVSAIHTPTLQRYIVEKAGWHPTVFRKIDWDAHKSAFSHYSRTKRISITKLAHGL